MGSAQRPGSSADVVCSGPAALGTLRAGPVLSEDTKGARIQGVLEERLIAAMAVSAVLVVATVMMFHEVVRLTSNPLSDLPIPPRADHPCGPDGFCSATGGGLDLCRDLSAAGGLTGHSQLLRGPHRGVPRLPLLLGRR